MKSPLARAFNELGHVLGVCPCCNEMFYLSEARPYLIGRRPSSTIDKLRAEELKLDRAEQKLGEIESELRAIAAKAGQRTAKKLLKKIDPIFSGAGYDPQDVKVIFNPISYVVFDGMSRDKLKGIRLLAGTPDSAGIEKVHKSIEGAIKSGNYEFKILRIDDKGAVVSQ